MAAVQELCKTVRLQACVETLSELSIQAALTGEEQSARLVRENSRGLPVRAATKTKGPSP